MPDEDNNLGGSSVRILENDVMCNAIINRDFYKQRRQCSDLEQYTFHLQISQ